MLSVRHGVALPSALSRLGYAFSALAVPSCAVQLMSPLSATDPGMLQTWPVTGSSDPTSLVECLPCRKISNCARGSAMIVLALAAAPPDPAGGPAGMTRPARLSALLKLTPVVPYAGAVPDGGRQGSRRRRPSGPHRLVAQGHRPFKAAARVRIPLGAPLASLVSTQGPVEQSVSSPPCQGGGRGFKSRQDRARLGLLDLRSAASMAPGAVR